MTIEEFLKLHGVTEAEWTDWLHCKSAPAPEQQAAVPDPSSDRMYLHVPQLPSDEFVHAQELREKFRTLFCDLLSQGRWRVTGRTGSASTRQDLEPTDWTRASIDFVGGRIGGYNHVVIEEAAAETIEDRLRSFIEATCSVALPKQSLTKQVIQDLAERLMPDVFQRKAFLRAWDSAGISGGWKKAGPPRHSDSD